MERYRRWQAFQEGEMRVYATMYSGALSFFGVSEGLTGTMGLVFTGISCYRPESGPRRLVVVGDH